MRGLISQTVRWWPEVKARVRCLANWAIQAPLYQSILLSPLLLVSISTTPRGVKLPRSQTKRCKLLHFNFPLVANTIYKYVLCQKFLCGSGMLFLILTFWFFFWIMPFSIREWVIDFHSTYLCMGHRWRAQPFLDHLSVSFPSLFLIFCTSHGTFLLPLPDSFSYLAWYICSPRYSF